MLVLVNVSGRSPSSQTGCSAELSADTRDSESILRAETEVCHYSFIYFYARCPHLWVQAELRGS